MTVTRIRTSSGWVDLQQGPQGPPGPGGTGVEGVTADSFEAYKMIMLSNGTVRAIPLGALPPAVPADFNADARISSVRLTWTPVLGASSYVIYRTPGGFMGQVSAFSFRDRAIAISSTYLYQIQAVDSYGQRSAVSSAVSAFIDPAINVDPIVSIRSWPAILPTDGQAILRVNAKDADAQVLSHSLDVDDGTITATADPTVWIYTP